MVHPGIRDASDHLSSAGRARKRRRLIRRIFWILAAVLLLCVAAALIGNAMIRRAGQARILTPEEALSLEADCILVLGAGVREDGTPSHMLQDRLKQGIALQKAGASQKLLMSGDHGRTGYNEVGVMKRYAVGEGVAERDVFMDHAGFSTYESLYRARDIFGAKRVIIVSQKYHLYRALYIAESLGLEAWGVSADLRTYAGQWMREVREIAARLKDALWCFVMPEPTYLGESIPISGDGNATNDGAYDALV